MKQVINGRSVVYFPSSCCWVVNGVYTCYSLADLAYRLSMSVDDLSSILTVF